MSEFESKLGKSLLIAGGVGLYALVRWWPGELAVPAGTDEEMVRAGLALLVLAGWLWLTEALPLAITALVVPVVAALSGLTDVTGGFAPFAHPLIFLFFGGFGLAAAMGRHGLDEAIGRWAIQLGRGRFYPTALWLFGLTAFLSMWISNTAAAALLVPVALGVSRAVGREGGGALEAKATPFLLLGIAYSASLGGLGTLTGTPPNAIAAAELGVDFAGWLGIGLPTVALLWPLMIVLLVVMCRPGAVPSFSAGGGEKVRLGKGAIGVLGVFAATLVAWLFSAPLGGWFGVEKGFDSVIAVAAVIALAALRLVDWRDLERGTEWGVLLLFGGGLALSKVLGDSGASLFLAESIRGWTSGWALLPFLLAVVLFVIFLTEISSNTATAALLVPIFASVAGELGLAEAKLVLPIAIAASCAFMLPVATPPNAIVFASGRVSQRQMVRAGLVLNLVFAAVLTVMARWWW